jgi:hypothetical protein
VGLRRLSIAVAIVVLGALAFAGSAQACSCAPMPRQEAMQGADAAISGRLLKVIPESRQRAVFRYRVQRVYKGAAGIRPGRVVSVHSARSSAACGLPTRTGRRYGLLLSRAEGVWTSGVCAMLSKHHCAS